MSFTKFLILFLFLSIRVYCEDQIYKSFTVSDGLPSSVVYCAVQDNDGYMWFGTDAGVSRFDGKEFKNFTVRDGLTDNDILKIYKDSKGRLWFLTLKGILCYYFNGKIYNPSNDAYIPNEKAYMGFISFLEDNNQVLWFGGLSNQLAKISMKDKTELYNFETSEERRGKSGWVFLYQPEKDRIILTGTKANHCYNTTDFYEVKTDFDLLNNDFYAFENSGKYKGIAITSKGIVELNGYKKRVVCSMDTLPFLKEINRIEIDKDQGLWAFSNSKTYYFERAGDHYLNPIIYFEKVNISRVYVDNEGNRWFCTIGKGLFKVSVNQKWISVLANDENDENVSNENFLSIFKDHSGTIRTGTLDGKFYSIDNTGKLLLTAKSPDKSRIVSISENENGRLFFISDKSLFAESDQTKNGMTTIKQFHLKVGSSLKKICFTKDNDLLISSAHGISIMRHNNINDDADNLIPNVPTQRVYALCVDHDNTLWFENFERLYNYSGGGFRDFPEFDSLFINKITDISETKDSTLIIVSQNNGIFFLKNREIIEQLKIKEWANGSQYRKLFLDGDDIYISSNSGFASLKLKNGKISDIKLFNLSSGIISNDVNDLVADQKYIYLATSEGLCRVDKNIKLAKKNPPVLKINSFKNEGINISNFNDLNFKNDNVKITVDFIAITFDQPEKIIYEYKIKDNDKWTESKNNNLQFSDLSPGFYSLSIRAKKVDSDWSKENKISFTVLPPFWKTSWFFTLSISLTVFIIYVFVRRITFRKYQMELMELKAKQVLEEERNRIASDMHDDFGADISRIAILSKVIKADPSVTKNAEMNAGLISSYAIRLRRKMDEIIWALDPANDKLINLISYVREFTFDFTSESKIECELILPEIDRDILVSATLRRNYFLIIKEALNNCMKHSEATKVSVTINIEQDHLLLEIRDNGKGFGTENKTGNGLNNMAARATQVHGTISVNSILNAGVIIKVKSPLHI